MHAIRMDVNEHVHMIYTFFFRLGKIWYWRPTRSFIEWLWLS